MATSVASSSHAGKGPRPARYFEQRQRRRVRKRQRLRGDEEGMFQSVLPTQFRVADRVGEDEPGRSRRKVPEPARRAFLKFVAGLQEMMQAQHVDVIRSAL